MNEVLRSRKQLGRGLSALLADDPIDEIKQNDLSPGSTAIAPISHLEANPDQPRKTFNEDDLEALTASIKEKGLLQPILVRHNPRNPDGYEIIAGERRWRAAQRAALHDVPIIVRDFSDAEALEVAIIENVQRSDLNPVEESEGYVHLLDHHDYTQEQLAQVIGKSRSHIANMTRLLKLPKATLEYLRAGDLSMGHARALIGKPDADAMADEIVKRGLTVREAEKLAGGDTKPKAKAKKPKAGKIAQPYDANTAALEADLSAALGAKVTLDHNGEGGELRISYTSLEQLDGLCERFGL